MAPAPRAAYVHAGIVVPHPLHERMLFIVGIVLGGLIAAARLAHQSGNMGTGWYRAFVAAVIVVGLVIAAMAVMERMEGA